MILVTGCAGFVGSALVRRLLAEGNEVTGIDAFRDFYPRKLKEKNMESFSDDKSFTFIEGDICKAGLGKILKKGSVVFHQAAHPGVRQSWGDEFASYVKDNIEATKVLLDACRKAGVGKLVIASSSSVYGNSDSVPVKEDAAKKPESPYGVTKLASENMCFSYQSNFGVPCIALRYFTVYGPGQRPDMAFNKFITAALAGGDITVYGDGGQTRDFTFIDDVVEANLLAMEADCAGEAINIAGGARSSIKDVLEIIGRLTGKEMHVTYSGKEAGDVRHTYADISKAKKLLGYEPRVGLESGLKAEIEWLKGG